MTAILARPAEEIARDLTLLARDHKASDSALYRLAAIAVELRRVRGDGGPPADLAARLIGIAPLAELADTIEAAELVLDLFLDEIRREPAEAPPIVSG